MIYIPKVKCRFDWFVGRVAWFTFATDLFFPLTTITISLYI